MFAHSYNEDSHERVNVNNMLYNVLFSLQLAITRPAVCTMQSIHLLLTIKMDKIKLNLFMFMMNFLHENAFAVCELVLLWLFNPFIINHIYG